MNTKYKKIAHRCFGGFNAEIVINEYFNNTSCQEVSYIWLHDLPENKILSIKQDFIYYKNNNITVVTTQWDYQIELEKDTSTNLFTSEELASLILDGKLELISLIQNLSNHNFSCFSDTKEKIIDDINERKKVIPYFLEKLEDEYKVQ